MLQESKQPLRVALYARVSTEEQREGQTIDSQIKELENFAQNNVWAGVGIYKDEGWSGAIVARPELDRLRDDAARKIFDAVLINDVDRLARDVTQLNVIRRDLERKGVRVIFRKLPGEASPTQNLMINILGSFAEFEREMILDRTRRGVRYKVAIRKQYLGSLSAYGYRYVPKYQSSEAAGRLEIVPEEAAVVRRIYQWVDEEGLSARKVVTRLNDLRLPARKQGKWAKSSVIRVLRNEMYAGVWYYNKHYSCAPEAGSATVKYSRVTKSSRRLRSKDHWIAVPLGEDFKIVTRQQWQRVQQKITANVSWSPRNSKHNYLLRGLVRCAGCNARMVGEPGRNSFSYRCHKRCKKVPEIVEDRLNSTVWGAVERALKNPKVILVQGRRYHEERKQISTAVSNAKALAQRSIDQIEREERRILEAYRQGVIEPAQLGRELEQLKVRRHVAKAHVENSEPSPEVVLPSAMEDQAREFCRSVSQVLGKLASPHKQQLLRILVREALFDGKQVIIKGRIPLDDVSTSEGFTPENPPVSQVSKADEFRRIAALTPSRHGRSLEEVLQISTKGDGPDGNRCGRNLAQFEFELVEEIKIDTSKANAARRLNLIKANAGRAHLC